MILTPGWNLGGRPKCSIQFSLAPSRSTTSAWRRALGTRNSRRGTGMATLSWYKKGKNKMNTLKSGVHSVLAAKLTQEHWYQYLYKWCDKMKKKKKFNLAKINRLYTCWFLHFLLLKRGRPGAGSSHTVGVIIRKDPFPHGGGQKWQAAHFNKLPQSGFCSAIGCSCSDQQYPYHDDF